MSCSRWEWKPRRRWRWRIARRHCAPGSQAGQHHADQGWRQTDGLWVGEAYPAGYAGLGIGTAFVGRRTMSGPTPVSPLTTAGSIVGTIQYMPPEQIEGKEADARSDIFAFGAVLYEMATGKRAFQGKSQISVASAILEKDPEPISRVSPLVLAAFDYLVASCLAKDREERFQTAHDVRLQLKGICAIFAVRGCDRAEPIFAHGRICRASAPRMVTTVACYAEWPSHLKRTSSAVGRKHYPER